jgi:hypothetical protein
VPGAVIRDNTIRSESARPLGVGILDNTGSATAPWVIRDNRFTDLARQKS